MRSTLPLIVMSAQLLGCHNDAFDTGEPSAASGTAVFEDMTEEQMSVALVAASGQSSAMAWLFVFMAQMEIDFEQTDCASSIDDGETFSIEADSCAMSSGTLYDGAASGTSLNLLMSFEESSSPQESSFQYDNFRIENDNMVFEFNGEANMEIGDQAFWSETMDVQFDAYSWSTNISLVCDTDLIECVSQQGSMASIDQLGDFAIGGTVGSADNPQGYQLILRGMDTLVVDIDPDAECTSYSIHNEIGAEIRAGELCEDEFLQM